MVALEAIVCGTPVLASKSLHSLPGSVSRPDEETVVAWADAIEQIRGTELEFDDTLDQHSVELINERLASIYSSKLSNTSTSD